MVLKVLVIDDTLQQVVERQLSNTVEVDFGDMGVFEGSFTISDPTVTVNSLILVNQSAAAATGKDADENEADALICRAVAANGSFTVYIEAHPGPVAGPFKLNYIVG